MKYPSEPLTPAEDAEIESPSQDHTRRCSIDQAIRDIVLRGTDPPQQKYTVCDRPKRGPVMWALTGTKLKFTQTDVIRRERLEALGHVGEQP